MFLFLFNQLQILAIVEVVFILIALVSTGFYVFIKLKNRNGGGDEDSDDLIIPTVSKNKNEAQNYPMPKRGGIEIGNAQNIGSRKEQQDSFGLSSLDEIEKTGLLAVLADGMGGMSDGASYSRTAVQEALRAFSTEKQESSDEATVMRVLQRAREAVLATDLTDGGTTFIAALIRNQQLHFVSVGDSRIYLLRNGGLIQLNREHVYGRELDDLTINGVLSRQKAAQDRQRAAVTSYLGKEDEMNVDRNINAIPLFSGDKVVLMSDGIFGFLPEKELAELLCQKPMDAAESVKNAVLAKKHPHQDNMTIIVLGIE